MNKKTILIGLGVLAVAGIGYYMWKKKSETTSGACGCSGADGEDSSSFVKGTQAYTDCVFNKREAGTSKEEAERLCGAANVRDRITTIYTA
jgi:hypothetical protein